MFDGPLRTRFLETPAGDWPALTRRAVMEQGQSYQVAISRALEEGRITAEVASREMKEIG